MPTIIYGRVSIKARGIPRAAKMTSEEIRLSGCVVGWGAHRHDRSGTAGATEKTRKNTDTDRENIAMDRESGD